MNLIKPQGRKLKWDIRFRNHDGRIVRVPGERDHDTTKRLADRIEMLVKAKQNGDPPPGFLQGWINGMPTKRAERLIELGLLDRRRIDQNLALTAHIDEFEKVVASRKTNSLVHAKIQANRVRRIIKDMKVTSFAGINEDDVLRVVSSWGLSVASRHHYLIAMKDFMKWAAKNGRALANPLADLKPPGQYDAPEVERVPLTVKQFRSLMAYLDGFEGYAGQQARWTARDRQLIYWVAVRTAYRKSELISLRVKNVHFDTTPPCISIKAKDAKNKSAGEVPIPTDLAVALKAYVKGREPDERLFPFPATSRSVINMFRRDLDGAGIKWNFGDDNPETVDFHTLRATAICWWLDVDGLSPKRVQILSRLKSLPLVAKYSRNLRLEDFRWLDRGPSLIPTRPKKKAG